MKPNIFIVYCSPANSTRHVAKVMESTLTELSGTVHTLDLGEQGQSDEFIKRLKEAGPNDCMFIGSPVYRDMAVPPIVEFIDSLPTVDGCRVVPFVTWGGAFSGIALWQMGQALTDKGFDLVGGAKVLGTHSMMWSHPNPVGQGHPDADDDKMISGFVREVYKGLTDNPIGTLPLEALDTNDTTHTEEIKEKLGQPWMIIPKTVDEESCNQCGICEEVCPVGAIELDDYPVFSKSCFDCFNCIRLCPEEAIDPAVPLEKIHGMISDRAEKFNEKPHTQVFMP